MTENSSITNITTQMRKGILEFCVMLILSRQRGYVSDLVSILQNANMNVIEGSLYTLLNRLRKEGKLNYHWEESPKGPPRKYYFLTELGRNTLAIMTDTWNNMALAVETIQQFSDSAPINQSNNSIDS